METRLPTEHGQFRATGYASAQRGAEPVALIAGPVDESVPVHVHTEYLTGDVLHSASCGCHHEPHAVAHFSAQGHEVVVYLRPAWGAQACELFGHAEADTSTAAAEWILADLGIHTEPTVTMPDPARPDQSATTKAGSTAA